MDELANFRFAPPELLGLESELFARRRLRLHRRIQPVRGEARIAIATRPPVSRRASTRRISPAARQIATAGRHSPPRLGFYGVIDERMDLDLVAALADARPDWDIEMVGPVVKIDPADLPQRPNLSYPGARTYDELPATLAAGTSR